MGSFELYGMSYPITLCTINFRATFTTSTQEKEYDEEEEAESQLQIHLFSFQTLYHIVSITHCIIS